MAAETATEKAALPSEAPVSTPITSDKESETHRPVTSSFSDDTSIHPSSDPEAPAPVEKEADVCPDGGYGWVCVICVFLVNAHTWGVNSSYGIFLSHYLSSNTYPGATPLEYAFVGGLSISTSQMVAPVATYMIRKRGIYPVLALGIFLQTLALLGASWSVEIWQLFLSQGLCFGFGMGFIFNATEFRKRTGTAGSGIGGLIWSLGTSAMIRSVGLGWAFRILAIVSAAVNTICTILIRDRNKAVGSVYDAFDYALLKRPEFVLTLLWGSFSIIGYICMLFSLPNYAVSIGLDASQASIVGAMLNLGQGIGRPLIGYFSDSLGRINMCLLCTAFCGVTIFAIWIPATSYGVLILFALLGGAVAGTIWTTVGPVTAEVIGLKDLPSALSLFWTSLILPSAFSEVMALELKRAPPANVYLHAQILTGMMFVGATFCLWFVRAWKINELDKAEEAEAAAGRTLDEKRREQEIRDDDQVPHAVDEGGATLQRTKSVARSVVTVAKASKGLFRLVKV